MQWFKFDPTVVGTIVEDLDLSGQGAYFKLMRSLWVFGPLSEAEVRRKCGPTFEQLRELMCPVGECLSFAWLEALRSEGQHVSDVRAAAATVRHSKQKEPSDVQLHANAMQLHTTSNALQDSKTPRLQDSKKDQDQEPAAEAPAKKTPAAKGERLLVDWSLPDDWKPDAIAAGVPVGAVDLEGRKFRDYWVAKTGKDATKMDWQATWRNWCRNAVARTYRPTQGKPSKHDLSQMNYSNGVTPDGKF